MRNARWVILLLAAVLLIAAPPFVEAANFVVSSTANAGPNTLRQAILDANANPGPDSISFSLPNNSVIELTDALPDIAEDLAINGPATGTLTVDGNHDSDVDYVLDAAAGVDLTVRRLTIIGATITGIRTGPITGSVVLEHVVLRDNGDGSGFGAGLDAEGVNATIRSSVIEGNTGGFGGGAQFLIDGDVVIEDSRIEDNEAIFGAGLYFFGVQGSVTILSSTISGNSAVIGAGIAVTAVFGDFDIDDTVISGNHAAAGGGIDNSFGAVNVTDSRILDNTAWLGGGVNNLAGFVSIMDSTVSGNRAKLGCDAPTYPDCDNNAPAGIAAQGGGLRNLAAWDENTPKGVYVGESLFQDNEANQGGAIFNGFDLRDQNPPGGVIIKDTKFTANEALPITLPDFEGPAAGGAIFNFGVLAIDGSTFLTNYAPEGGAIYNSSQLLLQDADRPEDPRDLPAPKNLQTKSIGPAAAAAAQQADLPEDPGGMNVTDTTFSKNEANDGNGGAIYSSGTMTIDHSAIDHNEASGLGGGIFNTSQSLIIRSLVLPEPGGEPGSAVLINVTIDSNNASEGGGIYNCNAECGLEEAAVGTEQIGFDPIALVLHNVTLTSNNANPADGEGGNIFNEEGGLVQFLNTIIAYGRPKNCEGDFDSLGNNLSDDASCGLSGPGDIEDTDPGLGPLRDNGGPTETRALSWGDPPIDAGNTDECPDDDQRHEPRPLNGDRVSEPECDIGAYEYRITGNTNNSSSSPTPTPTATRTPSPTPSPSPTPTATPQQQFGQSPPPNPVVVVPFTPPSAPQPPAAPVAGVTQITPPRTGDAGLR